MAVTMTADMPRKARRESGFGERLVMLRKARALTQVQLAEMIDSTQRAISYYENHAGHPPAHVVADLAKALSGDDRRVVRRAVSPQSDADR